MLLQRISIKCGTDRLLNKRFDNDFEIALNGAWWGQNPK